MLGGRRFLLASALATATALLFLGILYLPFMRLSSLLLIGHGAQEHTIATATLSLLRTDQIVLGGALVLLTIILPLLKWLYVVALALLGRDIAWLHAPGLRVLVWGPQDLIALAATAALIAGHETLAQHTAAGAYCFAGAVVAMALAFTWRPPAPELEAPATGKAALAGKSPEASGVKGRPILAALAGLAVLTFGLGLTQPVVRLSSAGAETADQSIVDLVSALQTRGATTLWVPLAILAIFLPGLRQLYLLTAIAAATLPSVVGARAVGIAGEFGRHATADTMLLALGLFYLMETHAADRVLLPGAYCLAASAVLTLIASVTADAGVSSATAADGTPIPAPSAPKRA
jgi:paraquat-inducible protein A